MNLKWANFQQSFNKGDYTVSLSGLVIIVMDNPPSESREIYPVKTYRFNAPYSTVSNVNAGKIYHERSIWIREDCACRLTKEQEEELKDWLLLTALESI